MTERWNPAAGVWEDIPSEWLERAALRDKIYIDPLNRQATRLPDAILNA